MLKVGWRHREAEHEADALRFWNGQRRGPLPRGANRWMTRPRCCSSDARPAHQLNCSVPEPEQDVIIAGLLRRLWARSPQGEHPFASLAGDVRRCGPSGSSSTTRPTVAAWIPVSRARASRSLRELPGTADRSVLLCTDLHAGNVLAAEREPWLVIDPKPFIGDPAFDPVQHMLNCDERLADDPAGLARRMADLLDLDPERRPAVAVRPLRPGITPRPDDARTRPAPRALTLTERCVRASLTTATSSS